MEEKEKQKEIQWVPLYLGWDDEKKTVKMKVDDPDNFAMAVGLLMRITLETTKETLIEEADARSKEEKDESSDDNA